MKYLLVLETSLERVLNESGRMVPSFSDSVPQGKPVALYFVIYPANTNSVDPKVTLQLFHDGKEVARKLVTLPEKQTDGSVHVLLQLNPDSGQCDVVVTAQQGTLAAQSRLSLKVDASADGAAS